MPPSRGCLVAAANANVANADSDSVKKQRNERRREMNGGGAITMYGGSTMAMDSIRAIDQRRMGGGGRREMNGGGVMDRGAINGRRWGR